MSDAPSPVIEPILMLFTINNALVARGLDGLSDADAWHQMEGKANPIAWIVGHVTETRVQMLTLLGAQTQAGWGGRFKRGSTRMTPADYPSRDDIAAQFTATGEQVLAALRGLSAERLASPTPVSFGGAKTLADLVAFFAFHEGYHVGQIGFIRKSLGHASLVG